MYDGPEENDVYWYHPDHLGSSSFITGLDVQNNPLLYIDPSGNLGFLAVIGIAIAVGIVSNGIANMIQGIPFWYGMGKAATMSAISGAISFGIGTAVSGAAASFIGKAAIEAGMHAISGGFMSALDGGNFGSGFLSGAISSIISTGIKALGTNFMGTGATQDVNRNYTSYNKFGKSGYFRAVTIATGGLSGGIGASIAGGSFWKGVRQGLITSGLNHVAHMGAVGIEEAGLRNRIKERIVDKYGEDYLNKPVTEQTLKELAEVFPELYKETAQDFSIANAENIKPFEGEGYRLHSSGQIWQNGTSLINGITDLFGSGKVLISPARMKAGVLKFASTWYHEGIHSMHAVSGFAMNVYSSFVNAGYENASRLASDVSEYLAHGLVSFLTGTPMSTFAHDNYYSGFNTWLNLKK